MKNKACERCREKKLKCDGMEPCGGCRQSELVCHRKQRKKRVVKHNKRATNRSPLASSPSSSLLTSVARKVPLYRSESTSSSCSPACLSQCSNYAETSSFTTQLSQKATPEKHYSTSECSCETHRDIYDVKKAIGLPLKSCQLLLDTAFTWKVLPLVHGSIDMKKLQTILERVFAFTDPCLPSVHLRKVAIEELVLILISMCLTFIYSPPNTRNSKILEIALQLGSPDHQDVKVIHADMYTLAMKLLGKILQDEKKTISIEMVQSVILIVLHDQQQGKNPRNELMDKAMRWAITLGIHQTTGYALEEEIKVRVWWFFVVRNWLAAPSTGLYTIHPRHFTTRLPIEVDMGDFHHGFNKDILLSIRRPWTSATYSISLIDLAKMVRQLVELRHDEKSRKTVNDTVDNAQSFKQALVESFQEYIDNLPEIYAMDTPFSMKILAYKHQLTIATATRITLERWLLHSQLLHCFLSIHEADQLMSTDVPQPCLRIANELLDSFDELACHCALVGATQLPSITLVTSATVIAIDLLNETGERRGKDVSVTVQKVATASEKARRLSRHKESLAALEKLGEFIEVLRRRLVLEEHDAPQTVDEVLEEARRVVGSSQSFNNIVQLSPADLWWQPTLLNAQEQGSDFYSNDGFSKIDDQLTEKPTDSAFTDVEMKQISNDETAMFPSVPSLSAIGPAFQLDVSDAYWDQYFQSIVGDVSFMDIQATQVV